ncbi:BCCT family transporter [Cellulomonas phragmiteti]|uniref:Choline transporter n=1 Tax=Cellulomonas phragmiteti TaxID=478780 RepID=A0ABQ4DM27_9CELL|nr:BCCT family transporter [Cellulomonas phragmiteti]GIG40400.1 choline transporter [Cellulomonas phragmiteti]
MTTPEVQSDDPAERATVPAAPSRVAWRVFAPAAVLIVLLAGLAVAFPARAERTVELLQADVIGAFGWYYVLIVAGFVVFALWMGLSRFGDIMLGPDDARPAFSLGSWFSMLFAAGMGIGLVFWGVAEPLNHFAQPRPSASGTPAQLAETAMVQTYMHWGVHAWSVYVVVGLALAYAVHRRGRPVSMRWAIEPLVGERRAAGALGDVVDVVAVVGTVFGLATSLGLGVLQISGGLDHLGVVPASTGLQVGLVIGITAVATVSVVSGLDRGLKWLSNVNVGLAGTLMACVLVLGPTLFLLREFVQSIGVYLSRIVPLSFNVSAFTGVEGEAWQAAWTTFYWGWWISWAPFVGVFIARISRGRTVREFVVGVLGVPVLATFLWFSVLGGTALHTELWGGGGLVGPDGAVDTTNALFDMLASLPGGVVLAAGAVLLIGLFFVTSADSGSFVVAMLTTGGHPSPRTWIRVAWAGVTALLAAALLVAGGLVTLQTAAILTALPFSVVMLAMVASTVRAFRAEHHATLVAERLAQRELLAQAIGEGVAAERERVARALDVRRAGRGGPRDADPAAAARPVDGDA